MRYNPLKLNNKAIIISVICSIFAIVLFVLSAFVSAFGVIYQITAILFAIFSLHLYIKYVLCEYVYEADEKNLKIYKVSGKKSICVASLSYDASKSHILTLIEYNNIKKTLPKHSYSINYAKNLYPENYYLYLFDFNGKIVRLKFEVNDVFADHVNKILDKNVFNKKLDQE